MTSFKLYKKEKLCSTAAITLLFSKEEPSYAAIAFPLRAVWRVNNTRRRGATIQFLVSVPKKRLHHAVDRVKMRRRIREAYRLNRQSLPSSLPLTDVAFIYISDHLQPYGPVETAMKKLLDKIQAQVTSSNNALPE